MAVLDIRYQPETLTASFTYDWKDTISESYLVQYDEIPTNIYLALSQAQTFATNPLPSRWAAFHGSPGIFVRSISPQFTDESRLWILWTYNYGPLEPGEEEDQQVENPFSRPPIYNVERFDSEYVVQSAKNVEALPHGDGKGGNRAEDTLGPIVNAAGKRPDEPVCDTESNAVLTISKAYAKLQDIADINSGYNRTTNSEFVQGYAKRSLKFLSCESGGIQTEGKYTYYMGTVRIEVKKTTDLILDNVGYEFWDVLSTDWAKARDKDGDVMSEPINLDIDGNDPREKDTGGGTDVSRITYRYLEEKPYRALLTPRNYNLSPPSPF